MHRFAAFAFVLTGCLHHSAPRPIEGAVLGRVVIYRNGVAFYERRATALDGQLSVRYDLWSVRRVDRDLLQGDSTFAVAPPTGVSPYAETGGEEELARLDAPASQGDDVGVGLAGTTSLENEYYVDGVNTTGLSSG